MLHRLLADFAVPGRLLAVPEGERRLTDLLHLGELLQEASTEIDGDEWGQSTLKTPSRAPHTF